MNISEKGLQLIRKWEGCRLQAYLDPVGIPTIGYGTIAYIDGRPVRLGDSITQEQAESLLLQECSSTCIRVARLLVIPVSQNQLDALVSLSYNIGVGAFADSTLLRILNQSDFEGAAQQFLAWNKGTIDGVKQEISGLTNRRVEEKALFESTQPEGAPILLDHDPSPQQRVRWLEAYSDEDKTIIVGWVDSDVVEILSLDSRSKKQFVDTINQYPNAANLLIAPPGKPVPEGPRIIISESRTSSGSDAAGPPPPPPSGILARGAEGESVTQLQLRLKELGYYNGPINGQFDTGTDSAVRRFQADAFGNGEADGRVGSITWGALWKEPPAPTSDNSPPGEPGKTYLRLTKTGKRDHYGLTVLLLDYIKDGTVAGTLEVCSGAPGRQSFRTGAQSQRGSFEPLPEGLWRVHDIAWCDGKDNYHGSVFASGLGPVSTPVDYVGPGQTARLHIEIHIDYNRGNAPGTAGCIGILSVADYKILVGWLRDTDPRDLYVDWGCGTCPQP